MRTKKKVTVLAAVGAVLAALLGIPSSPAQADLINPRQDWLRAATAGLFLHWGERTSPTFTSCSGWQNAVNNPNQTGGRWEARKWVDAAIKLHAGYIVLAAFHSRLGYARAWPSKIPGTCSTTRDYLRELINEAHGRGVKVINYMTDDPSHHNENGFEYFNSAAYSSFKGRTINLATENGFGEFSYDNFFEVMTNYPDLDGFWIDNNNDFWLSHNLYQQIHAMRSMMLLSNNNEDTPEMDTVSHEQKTGMTPPYDMPQAIWTPAPRLTEADYKLPSSGAWWYDGSDSTVDRKLSVGRYVANAGSSIKSLMAETAKVNGDFPSNQVSFNTFADGYFRQIWESIGNTNGGGYMWGGLQPGPFGNGAYGVTTVNKDNGNIHYVHVLDRPTSGSSVTVGDNGYHVTGVTDLRTGATRSFTQANGKITISGIATWDAFDTVLKVNTDSRVGIYPTGSVTATASVSASGHGASALVDGNYLTYWDNNTTLPATITLDLGSAKKVQYLAVNQREWSPTHNRTTFGRNEDSARIKAYTIQQSSNGTSWSTVTSGTMPSRRGVQFVNLGLASARFVRLIVNSTWSASTVTAYANKLRIDEMWLASDYVNGGVIQPPPNRFEAEDATLSNATVATNHTGFSGTGFVDYVNAVGGFIQWSASRTTAGSATLAFRFANGSGAARPMDISVNGGPATSVSFPATANWDTWQTLSVPATLNAGGNTVRATATGAAGGPNVDWLEVS